MALHNAGQSVVIPIMVRSCDWKGAPFEKLQGLPADMKAITAWTDRDAAWTSVAAGVRQKLEELKQNAKRST